MAIDPGFAQRLARLIQEERTGLQGFIALLRREAPGVFNVFRRALLPSS